MSQYNQSPPSIHVIGAGGLARDFHACFKKELTIIGFWDDGVPKGTLVNGIPVLGTIMEFKLQPTQLNYVIMVANPEIRRNFATILNDSAHKGSVIIHSLARIFNIDRVKLGDGCIVFPGTMITTEVTVGAHTLIHTNCSLHHDSVVGSYCALMPGARLTGNVTVGDEVLIGSNIALTNGMKIGNGERII